MKHSPMHFGPFAPCHLLVASSEVSSPLGMGILWWGPLCAFSSTGRRDLTSSVFSHRVSSPAFDHLYDPPLDHSSVSMPFLHCEEQNGTQYSTHSLASAEKSSMIASLSLPVMPLWMQLRNLFAFFAAAVCCWLLFSLSTAIVPGPFSKAAPQPHKS